MGFRILIKLVQMNMQVFAPTAKCLALCICFAISSVSGRFSEVRANSKPAVPSKGVRSRLPAIPLGRVTTWKCDQCGAANPLPGLSQLPGAGHDRLPDRRLECVMCGWAIYYD